MPRITQLPVASTANLLDSFPIVQGGSTYSLTFNVAKNAGMFLPANYSIGTLQLSTQAVTSDILASSVSADENRAVTTNHIRALSVTTAKISDLNVTNEKLADGAVTTAKLADNSLVVAKFGEPDRTFIRNSGTARPGSTVVVSGSVENIVVYTAGSGYSSVPAVTITASPTGDNATATAVMTGISPNLSVASITITYAGSGYTTNPTVTIAAPSSGTTALAVAYSITSGLSTANCKHLGTSSDQAGFFITTDKKVKCTGYNRNYKLAIGLSNANTYLPMECAFGTNSATKVVPHMVFPGRINTYVIDTLGRVWVAGYGGNGALGISGYSGDSVNFTPLPQASFGNKPVTYLTFMPNTDATTVIAITADKKAYGWGYNNQVELGTGAVNVLAPTLLVGGDSSNFSDAVVTGGIYGMSLLVEAVTGRVLCSGYNGYGQLSQGNTTGRTSLGFFLKSAGTPIGIGAEGKIIKALASGEGSYGFSVLLTDTGKVFTAGYNGVGQLGNNSTTATNSGFATEVISSLVTDIYVSTGNTSGGYVMAKKSDGSLWAWGSNNVGNFGAVGSGGALNNVNGTPTRVWNPATYGVATKVVLCGSDNNYSSYVLSQTGIIYSAGLNTYGQQSNANNNNANIIMIMPILQ